jgi:hypothetical protein
MATRRFFDPIDLTVLSDDQLRARLPELRRKLQDYGYKFSRCNYLSPKGLAYSEVMRELMKRIDEAEAERDKGQITA